MFAPNRIAVYVGLIAGIAGALVPVLSSFDTSTAVGWIGGLGLILGTIAKYLDGWQKYEERAGIGLPTVEYDVPPEGDYPEPADLPAKP